MSRYLSITLAKRGVSCTAVLLDKDAPGTCAAVWQALPLQGPAQHAKYARNEVYAMVPRFTEIAVGQENPTVTPIPGDVVFFDFPGGMLDRSFKEDVGVAELPGVIDLAIFYGRNNLLPTVTSAGCRATSSRRSSRGWTRWPRRATTSGDPAASGRA